MANTGEKFMREQMKSSIATITLTLLLFGMGLFGPGERDLAYGSAIIGCVYTENQLPVPQELVSGRVIVAKDAYLAVGFDPDYNCLKTLGAIDREIVNSAEINNITIGQRYFTSRGLTIKRLKKGTVFQVVAVVAVTKHGFTTIDSGPGPIYHLILQDQDDVLYQIATVNLGVNQADLFLAFAEAGQPVDPSDLNMLSPDCFNETSHYQGANSITYTGELTNLSEDDLIRTEPYWKTLTDRLERGEGFPISIRLKAIDENNQKIVWSEDFAKRRQQISRIQERFLRKLPDTLVISGIEKNIHHPYLVMDANLELLHYLVEEQATLQVETFGELVRLK